MNDRIEQILSRRRAAQPEKEKFSSLYESVYRYFMPDKYKDLQTYKDDFGNNTRVQIYSSIGEATTDGCVQSLQSLIAPVNYDWIDFEVGFMFENAPPDGKDEASRRLGELAKILNIYKANSNFDTAFTSALYDLVPGQMCLLIVEGTEENPLVFAPVPFREITISRGKSGDADAFYRDLQYKKKDVLRVWKDASFACCKDEEEQSISILEATEYNFSTKKWDYIVIDTSNDNKVLLEREFITSPFVEMPWTITAGETYGRGPGLKAIADFLTLNKLKEYALRSMAFLVPFFLVKQGENYKNWIIRPGALLPVSQNPREDPAMMQMGVSQQADLTQFNMENLEMSIKKTMFNLDVPNSRNVTATEYADRKAELVKQVMNSYGRLVSMLNQIVRRMIEVLQRQGLFPLEVDVDMFNGFGAKIKMNTILANGQKLESVREKLNAIGMLNNFDPSGRTTQRFVKTDLLIPKLLRDIGMEVEDIRNTTELMEYDQQIVAAQIQAMQIQAAQAAGAPNE